MAIHQATFQNGLELISLSVCHAPFYLRTVYIYTPRRKASINCLKPDGTVSLPVISAGKEPQLINATITSRQWSVVLMSSWPHLTVTLSPGVVPININPPHL